MCLVLIQRVLPITVSLNRPLNGPKRQGGVLIEVTLGAWARHVLVMKINGDLKTHRGKNISDEMDPLNKV